MWFRSISAAAAVLALSGAARATEYSVSEAGSDSASGLPGDPWKTLQKAVSTMKPGDVAVADDGSYAGVLIKKHSGAQGAPIVLRAKNTWGAKIVKASGAASGDDAQDFVNILSSSFITIDGFEVSGAPRAGISARTFDGPETGEDTRGIVVQNCHVHDNGGGSPKGRHDGIFTGFALDVLIQDNVVHDNSEHGIYVSNSADNPIIRRNLVFANDYNGIQINADVSTGGDGVITNWLIEGNVVYGNGGGAAFNLDGVVGGVIRNNLAYDNAKAGIALFWGDGAVGSSDNLVVNNTIYNPQGTRAALQVADGADGNIVFNNILYAGNGAGLEVQSVSGLVHRNNLVSSYEGAAAGDGESSPDVKTLFADLAADDYHLAPGSAAVDTGLAAHAGASAPATDIEGAARPAGAAFDIGAYELGGDPPVDADAGAGAGGAGPGGGPTETGGSGASGGAAGGSVPTGSGTGATGPTGGGGSEGGSEPGADADEPRAASGSADGCGCRCAPPASGAGLLVAAALVQLYFRRRRRKA